MDHLNGTNTNTEPMSIKVALILASFSLLLPVFNGYVLTVLVIGWLVANRGWRYHENILVRSLLAGIVLIWVGASLAGFFAPYSEGLLREWNKAGHLTVKLLVLPWVWFAAISKLQTLYPKFSISGHLAKPLFIFLVIYCVYIIIQRYTGINWAKSPGEMLPWFRMNADGTYRPNGAISHPLTFSYNLLLVFGFCLFNGLKTLEAKKEATAEKISSLMKPANIWFASCFLCFLMLFLSGSRWPLVCLLASASFVGVRTLGKKSVILLLALPVLAFALYLENSMISRFAELFQNLDRIESYFQRVLFWKGHLYAFLESPIYGTGLSGRKEALAEIYRSLGQDNRNYSAHNIYLQFAANSGAFGIFALASILIGMIKFYLQLKQRVHKLALEYFFLVLILSGLMQNNLRDSEFCFALWFSIAFLISNQNGDKNLNKTILP